MPSTTWLRRDDENWRVCTESNREPSALEAAALPVALHTHARTHDARGPHALEHGRIGAGRGCRARLGGLGGHCLTARPGPQRMPLAASQSPPGTRPTSGATARGFPCGHRVASEQLAHDLVLTVAWDSCLSRLAPPIVTTAPRALLPFPASWVNTTGSGADAR